MDELFGKPGLPSATDRESLPYMNAIVKEATRWLTVAPLGSPHRTDEDDIINGYVIPKNAIIVPNTWSFNNDPTIYPNPRDFEPGALDPGDVSFGFGRRVCPGRLIAETSIFLIIAHTLAVFDIRKPAENGEETKSTLDSICDEQQPCSRCHRLKVPCEGSGQQRYQFKNVKPTPRPKAKEKAIRVRSNLNIISQAPCNPLANRFIRTLDISDIRFDISFYGSFLKDLPRRLGESAVLDAAAQALVSSHPFLHRLRGKEVPRDALIRFWKSVKALRQSLDNPVEIRSPHTLCAIYLISICQAWLGKYEKQSVSHGTAIAHLLKIVDISSCKSGFERDLIATLSVPVILDGICNPRVQMAPSFWNDVMALVQQGSPSAPDTYTKLREDAQNIYPYLDQPTEPAGLPSPVLGRPSRHRAAYTVVIALALLLNTILRVLDLENTMLATESSFFCERILNEAELASCYRPIGAAYAVPCLVVWVLQNLHSS
ncbi:Cytochrome P450 [Penicillium cf. viridicatum]|uniref:Cytochrome P450 n=1 Tax=Penicillium cf. viridicatum TaxID=2972119 RepID=A0A9W9M8B8_9EURO|nr:Cytochrome P450 [Penicillium cf. viridicatum]